MEQEIEGRTFLQFAARVAAICMQESERPFEPRNIEDCWYLGLSPREAYEELRLERELDKNPELQEWIVRAPIVAEPRVNLEREVEWRST